MIENYDERNRDETIEAVAEFDGERLAEFIEFEREHKDRVTVIEPLERKLVDVVPPGRQQYVAGIWFDDPDEPETARRAPRIEAALAEGDLEQA
jgi:hypothetical protein